MKAIILAAGAGRRLASMGWTKPKCLLPCPDGTLLDNSLSCLTVCKIHDVAIVVGHQRDLVEQSASRHPLRITYVENEQYESTNTARSLALASAHLHDEVLYFNADVWFECALLERLIREGGSVLVVDVHRRDCEAVKVRTNATGKVLRIGKELDSHGCNGEFIGIAKFDHDLCAALRESLAHWSQGPLGAARYFESALDAVLDRVAVSMLPMAPNQALEIDTPEDYREAWGLWQDQSSQNRCRRQCPP